MNDGIALLLLEAWSAADGAHVHLVTEKDAYHIRSEKKGYRVNRDTHF